MALTDDLISQFVKITNDKKDVKTESTVYGTIRIKDGKTFVRLDGASDDEILTPVTAAANAIEGERVTVMIKNHTAVVTGNLSSPLARSGDVADAVNETIHEFNDLLAQKVSTEELDAERARIDDLVADNATIKGLLEANDIDVGQLQADYITVNNALTAVQADVDNLSTSKLDAEIAKVTYAAITDLEATNVEVHNLQATYGEFAALTANHFTAIDANINALTADKLDAETARLTYATIAELDATNAEIDKLSASVADIDTLMFGSATGSTIQTSFANAVIAQLGDAQIKAAMIESVSASQITAGDIITNNVRVRSEDGSLVISDETIQISDLSRVRVQIGKDATGDYSINVWDQNGNLMFSEGGITDSAIKDAIIRNDMVSDTANIAAHKLDIDSLFEEINGSANTIKSTKIYLDDEAQTLDVAFKALETDVNGLGSTVSSQGTQLSIVQDAISSKVWKQDIDAIAIGGRNILLNTDFGDNPVRIERQSSTQSTEIGAYFDPSVSIEMGAEYTFSARIRGNANILFYEMTDGTNKSHRFVQRNLLDENEFRHFSLTFTADATYGRLIRVYICTQWGEANTLVGDWFEIESRSVKLERGNKATDWTPAPEDTDSVLSSLSDQYTSLEQTIESISATVASHTTEISSKADGSIVTEMGNKVGNLELSLGQFKTSVSETYSTKTELRDANAEIEAIELKVASAESAITQNEASISSLVSRTEFIENNHPTSENVSSSIEQKANSIMSSIRSTYATLADLDLTNSEIDGLTIGGRNLLLGTSFDGVSKRYERLATYGTEGGFHFYPSEQLVSGVKYVLSLSIRGNANIVFYEINTSGGNVSHAWMRRAELSETEYRDFYLTFTVGENRVFGNVYICTQYGEDATAIGDWFEIKPCSVKLERGNRKTDWTPAPEDMATAKDNEFAQSAAEAAQETATNAETLIQQLSDSISMLVTDGNGTSLMTQTDEGWTFSTAKIQTAIASAAENLDALNTELGDTNHTVNVLQQAVADLGEIAEYVKIGTYEDEPCIELGEGDSEFKLRITNTQILFMEGSSVIAHFTNQSLHIKKAVIEEELQQGEFVWKARSNGNLGLIWKGVNS